jgi:hypothetical protein
VVAYDGWELGTKNRLGELDLAQATPPAKKKKKRKRLAGQGHSKAISGARNRERLPPPVPKNRGLAEIEAMPDTADEFRHPNGYKPRPPGPDADWKAQARWDKQQRANARRAKVRKWEAKVEAAGRVMEKQLTPKEKGMELYDDDKLVAEGMLDLSDWSNEELIRGYRKNRNGKFGKPPKYIPREIQQMAFRQLINRGDRRLKEAYYDSIEKLVELAHGAGSEKVRLEAIRELMNRVAGKIPDKVLVAREEPWEGILADALVPINESIPIDLEVNEEGVAVMAPVSEDDYKSGGEVEATSSAVAATARPAQRGSAPSPSRRPVVQEVRVVGKD